MNKLIASICKNMLKQNLITKSDFPIYYYGLRYFVFFVIYFFIVFVVGLIFNRILELIIFFLIFSILRQVAGGVHLKNDTACLLISIFMLPLFCILLSIVSLHHSIWLVLASLSSIVICVLAPIDNINKTLDDIEVCHYRKKTKKIVVIQFLLVIVCYFSLPLDYTITVSMSLITNALSMLLGKYSRYFKFFL